MKKIILTALIIIGNILLTSCDDLVNDMNSYERMTVEESADVFSELVLMNLASASGALIISDEDTSGISISVSSSFSCISITGDTYIPYTGTTWDASLSLNMDNCSPSLSNSVFNGSLAVHLSGPQGSVSSFDYYGTLKVKGDVEGAVTVDLHYETSWAGSINGYSIQEILDVLGL